MKRPDLSARNTTHGLSDRPEYAIWCGMKQRCNYKKHKDFNMYGGRGISVCSEWNDFAQFLEDMGDRPDGMTLDRIDSNGNYSKDNCRWATPVNQARNTRRNKTLTYQGVTKCVTEWAESLDKTPQTLFSRIRYGWSDEEVIQGKRIA